MKHEAEFNTSQAYFLHRQQEEANQARAEAMAEDALYNEQIAPKPGKIMSIYQKPLTWEDYEGEAKLLREYRPDEGDGVSMWAVEFVDEPGEEYLRTICV